MNLRWLVVPGVFAAAACAVNHDADSARRSSSRAEVTDAGAANDSVHVVAAPCVRATRIPLFAGSRITIVTDLNERGELVGYSSWEDGTDRGFYWNGSRRIDFDGRRPWSINDLGDIVLDDENGHAFLWRDGQQTELGPGETWVSARDINNAGQIVGSRVVGEKNGVALTDAVLWDNGVLRDLGAFGSDEALALFINEKGMIAGEGRFVDQASGSLSSARTVFTWQNGNASVISPPSEFATAVGINEDGAVAFSSAPFDGFSSGYLWQGGAITTVHAFDAVSLDLSTLNDRGEVAGGAAIGYLGGGEFREARTFVWRAGIAQNVVAPDGASSSIEALGNQGMAVGAEAFFPNGVTVSRAVAWQDGRSVYLEDADTKAVRVSSHGIIAGVAGTDARIWDASACFGTSGDDDDDASPPDAGASSSSSSSGSSGRTW